MIARYFKDRVDGGMQLLPLLQPYAHGRNTIVVGLPRGGVVTAAAVAKGLDLPLDIVVPRKIGAPDQPELAVGALTEDGTVIFNNDIMRELNLTPDDMRTTIENEKQEAQRRVTLYRAGMKPRDFKGKTIIVVDDGIATGATMRAALEFLRAQGASKLIVATPVAARDALKELQADNVYCPLVADYFPGIGYFYGSFGQVTDQEVIALLKH